MAQGLVRVLGLDPASAGATGYAIVEQRSGMPQRCIAIHYGILAPQRRAAENTPARLEEIHRTTLALIQEFLPQQMAVESIFAALNVKTALRLAEVRGVILLAAAQSKIPVYSYSPREVKAIITGYGQASKEQIQQMVRALLGLAEIPKPADAADALAVALCHLRYRQTQARFGLAASLLSASRPTTAGRPKSPPGLRAISTR